MGFVRFLLGGLAGLSVAGAGAPLAGEPAPQPSRALDGAAALEPFFAKLDGLKAGGRPVQVLQIGDSHSAADLISSGVRVRLQARFGEGGRGVMPPGAPFKGYAPRQMEVAQSTGWRVEPSFPYMGGAFGIAGWRLTALQPGASLTLAADPEAQFDEAVVCAVSGPGEGQLELTAGDAHEALPLAAADPGAACRKTDYSAPQANLQIAAEGGPVTLLSYATYRLRAGVVWSNLGVSGSQLSDFAERDDKLVKAELDAYAPDLIVLAYGTNEGFDPKLDIVAYEAMVHAQLQRLKRLAPQAAILVLGPPDAELVRPDIPEDGIHDKDFACAPLTAEETAGYAQLVADRSPVLARWYAPPTLAQVREAQRRAAAAEGAAFWDWSGRMGGDCSAHRLSRPESGFMRGDHIHFTSDGGEMIASLLTDDLMAAYAARGGKG